MDIRQSADILFAGILFTVVGFVLPMVSFNDMSMLSLLRQASLNLQVLTFFALILGTLINIGMVVAIFRDTDLDNRALLLTTGLIVVGIAGLAAYWLDINGQPLFNGQRLIILRIGFYVTAIGAVIQLVSLALLARKNTAVKSEAPD